MKATQEKLQILLDDAKSAAGGGDLTLVERVNELHDKLNTIRDLLDSADQLQETASGETDTANIIATQLEKTILQANKELTVSFDDHFSFRICSYNLFNIGRVRSLTNRWQSSATTRERSFRFPGQSIQRNQ